MRALLSKAEDRRRSSWGEKETELTSLVWPFRVARHSPVSGDQSLMLRSAEPEAEQTELDHDPCGDEDDTPRSRRNGRR